MKDTRCVAYALSKNRMGCVRLNAYYGSDTDSRDLATCAALINTDKNHFYFVHPDQVPHKSSYNYACLWCSTLSEQRFCDAMCESSFDLDVELDLAEQNINTPIQYRFTSFK